MDRFRRQEGSTLLMLIGIIAALAVMTATLVMLLGNVSHNSSVDRMRAKSFNVTEAGMDAALYTLAVKWPAPVGTVAPSPTPTIDTTAFAAQFPASQFPPPRGGQLLHYRFYDNSDTNGDGVIGYGTKGWDAAYDKNGDGYMWVETQSGVAEKQTRIKALVMRGTFDLQVPRGVALYTSDDLWMHGGGTSVGVSVPPPGGVTTAYVGGTLTTSGGQDFSSDISPVVASTGGTVPPVNTIMNEDILNGLVATAKESGRYFTGVKADVAAEAATGWEGLVVVENCDVTIQANGVLNGDGIGADKPPGIIIVLNGDLRFDGTPTIYGMVYVAGGFTDIGHAQIQGMVTCDGGADIGGSEQVMYNDNVIVNLNRTVTLNVRIVPNNWKELPPRSPWPD